MLTCVKLDLAEYTKPVGLPTQLSETSYPTRYNAQKSTAIKLVATPKNWLAESLAIKHAINIWA